MQSRGHFLSPGGRLTPRPFIYGAIAVYVAGAASHLLTSPDVITHGGLWPFLAAQIVLLWVWFAVHAKRLRDAGHGSGLAAGVALLYALSVALLIIVAASFFNTSDGLMSNANATSALGLVMILYIISALAGSTQYDIAWAVVAILMLIAVVPIAVSVAFSDLGCNAAEHRKRTADLEPMLHFAYGSNMHRAVMRRHAPAATPLGVAELENYRFVITPTATPRSSRASAQTVFGLLWRLTPRDRVTLDLWENIAGGLYRAVTLPVQYGGRHVPALVYLARPRPHGQPKPGYMEIVVKAAGELELPDDYVASLQRWLPKRPLGAGHRKLEGFG